MKGNKSKLGQTRLTDEMILTFLAQGLYCKEIAVLTGLSENKQVSRRLRQIYKKHGVTDRVSLLLKTGTLAVVVCGKELRL